MGKYPRFPDVFDLNVSDDEKAKIMVRIGTVAFSFILRTSRFFSESKKCDASELLQYYSTFESDGTK